MKKMTNNIYQYMKIGRLYQAKDKKSALTEVIVVNDIYFDDFRNTYVVKYSDIETNLEYQDAILFMYNRYEEITDDNR